MIGKNIEAARLLVEAFRGLIDFSAFPVQNLKEFDALARTATDERFPGALLTLPRVGKRSVYYAIADNAAEWRRLRPLLIAYAGPTLTSFQGWPEPLLPHLLPIEALLEAGCFHVVARIVPGETEKVQKYTSRSLLRLVDMVTTAPSTTSAVPLSTSRLLAHFSDCLNGNDFVGAERILEQCARELRIDALNLLFLRIRLLSWFNNWQGLVEMPEFRSVCHTRRPPAVTAALLEAVYQVWVRDKGDIPELSELWAKKLRPEFLTLLQLPILPGVSSGALTLFALEALSVATRNPVIEMAVMSHRDATPELAAALQAAGRTGAACTTEDTVGLGGRLPTAQQALVQAERSNTLETIARALQLIDALEAGERESLLASTPFRSLWQSVSTQSGKAPPASWQDWFRRLQTPEFTDALAVLSHAVTEWPAALLKDTVEINAFVSALQEVPDIFPSADRLADALPALVTWVLEDQVFPRPSMLPVYDALLYQLLVGVRRSGVVFESAAVLIRALLCLGLSPSRYRELLDDCLMLTGEAMSKRTVYWVLDTLEETLLNPCPDEEARRGFWYAACARLMQMKPFFSPGQKIVFVWLSAELGWQSIQEVEERIAVDPMGAQRHQLQSVLDGSYVAIYTLTESAGRQAATVLKELSPSVRVEMSHDKVASSALKSMAQQADIFVMVAASAKHAASGYIQQERQGKPLLYANGRGYSSIIRAVETFILGGE
ncbi:protein DpdD [Duganella sp. CT11-25]|uniref:protein DpdD n=1 Tax=unclassified Duganella TaxID=2636909 RepID=UPI0039AEB0F9